MKNLLCFGFLVCSMLVMVPVHAQSLAGPYPVPGSGGGISPNYAGAVTFTNPANVFGGAFTGDGSGLTNLPASGGGGVTNNLPSGTTNIDAAASAAAGSPIILTVPAGTYYTAGLLTNVGIIGAGVNKTFIICTNTSWSNNPVFADLFIESTNGLVWKNFSTGFSYASPSNTMHGVVFFRTAGTAATNIIEQVAIPNYLAAFDGIYSLSTNNNYIINNLGVTWDEPWDCFNFINGGIFNIQMNGGTYIAEGVTNATNPNGNSHVFQTPVWQNGSYFSFNGVTMLAPSSTNGFPLLIHGSAKTNTIQLIGCAFRNGGTNYDVDLNAGSIGGGYVLKTAIQGCLLNSIAYSSKYSGTNLSLNYNNWQGTNVSKSFSGDGSGLTNVLDSSITGTSNTLAPTSITFPATSANWTNTFGVPIMLYIDNTAVTGTSLSINGGVVFSGLSLDETITLQNGDWFSEAYTIGTPTAKWHPYP